MLLSEFIKDFGVKKYFRTPKNLDYSLLVNFIQLVLEGDWFGKAEIPQDFSQNADILEYFRVLDQEGHPERDALRFGDVYIILSSDRYRYGVFLNNHAVLEQPNHLNPQHEVLKDDINKHIAWVKSRGFDVVLLRPLNEKNIFPSDDLRYIKQDKPFAHVVLDEVADKFIVYAPGNHVTYDDPIWGLDPTNKQIEVLAKQEIYRPLWLHVFNADRESIASFEGTYDDAHFSKWEIPTSQVTDQLGMFALLRREDDAYTTDDVKWTDKVPKRGIWYNVRDFGAAGDNVQDDGPMIAAAIDAAKGDGGGVVFFPAGTYKITDRIFMYTGVTLMGVGRDELDADEGDPSTTGSRIMQHTNNKDGIYLEDTRSCRIQGLSVYGPLGNDVLPTTTGIGINFNWTSLIPFFQNLTDVSVRNFRIGVQGRTVCVSNMTNVLADNMSDFGFNWPEGGTSVSWNDCWSRNARKIGYRWFNSVYQNLSGCAGDFNGVTYWPIDAQSICFSGCGSEYPSKNGGDYDGISWRIDNSSMCSILSGWVTGNKNIGCDVINTTQGLFFQAADNSPEPSATYWIQTEPGTYINIAHMYNSVPNNITPGTCVQLNDGSGTIRPAQDITFRNNQGLVWQNAALDHEDVIFFRGNDDATVMRGGGGDIFFEALDGTFLAQLHEDGSGLDMRDHNITALLDPVNPGDAMTLNYADGHYTPLEPTHINIIGPDPDNHLLEFSADPADGVSEYSILVNSTGTLTFFGAGANQLHLALLDGDLHLNSGRLFLQEPNPPASASASGADGQIGWDANYLYLCTGTDTWKRVAIATW